MSLQTLAKYIKATRRLLADSTAQVYRDTDLIDYINEARLRTVIDTGCTRLLQSAFLQGNQETYRFGSVTGIGNIVGGSGFTNGTYNLAFTSTTGTGAAGTYTCSGGAVTSATITAGGTGYQDATVTFPSGGGIGASATVGFINDNTVDVLNVTLLYGIQRIPLNFMAFTRMNAYLRSVNVQSNWPTVFSIYGQDTLYLQPQATQTYQYELDTVPLLDDLVNNTDTDVIRAPYTLGIPLYAAYLAKYMNRQFQEADVYLADYEKRMQVAQRGTMTRRVPSAYGR